MSEFTPGQKVIVNGGLIATVVNYSPETNLVIVEHPVGSSTNTVTLHISNTTLEPLSESLPAGTVVENPAGPAETAGSKFTQNQASDDADELTTLDAPEPETAKHRGDKATKK